MILPCCDGLELNLYYYLWGVPVGFVWLWEVGGSGAPVSPSWSPSPSPIPVACFPSLTVRLDTWGWKWGVIIHSLTFNGYHLRAGHRGYKDKTGTNLAPRKLRILGKIQGNSISVWWMDHRGLCAWSLRAWRKSWAGRMASWRRKHMLWVLQVEQELDRQEFTVPSDTVDLCITVPRLLWVGAANENNLPCGFGQHHYNSGCLSLPSCLIGGGTLTT